MSFMDKLKASAREAGAQAQVLGKKMGDQAKEGYEKLQHQQRNGGFNMNVESPMPKDLRGEAEKSARILRSFLDPATASKIPQDSAAAAPAPSDSATGTPLLPQDRAVNRSHDPALNAIPHQILLRAKGLAIFTVLKAGFMWSGKLGSGLVVARLPDGSWSAPSCIGTGGVGFGLQIGADITDYVIILNTDEAVKAFAMGGNVTLGGGLSVAAGPVGAGGSVQTAISEKPPMLFSYQKSKGLFAGVNIEGSVIVERRDANTTFYGTSIPAIDLLTGKVPAPEAAEALYQVLEASEAGELAADGYGIGEPDEVQNIFSADSKKT